jgi:hypothetical protein
VSLTSPYAMRVMQDTPVMADLNPTVATLTKAANVTGWDTPISGDMLAGKLTTPHDTTCGECGRKWSDGEHPAPSGRCPWEHHHGTRRRFAVGSIAPLWGHLGHNVRYVTENGDTFSWYVSDPDGYPMYAGRQVTE